MICSQNKFVNAQESVYMRPRSEFTKVFSHCLTLQLLCMAYTNTHHNETKSHLKWQNWKLFQDSLKLPLLGRGGKIIRCFSRGNSPRRNRYTQQAPFFFLFPRPEESVLGKMLQCYM